MSIISKAKAVVKSVVSKIAQPKIAPKPISSLSTGSGLQSSSKAASQAKVSNALDNSLSAKNKALGSSTAASALQSQAASNLKKAASIPSVNKSSSPGTISSGISALQRSLSGAASKAGNYAVDTVGGGINRVASSIRNSSGGIGRSAIGSDLGASASDAFDRGSDPTTADNISHGNYRGNASTDEVTYLTPASAAAGFSGTNNIVDPNAITPEKRKATQDFIASSEQARLASLAATKAEADKTKAALDAAAAAAADPTKDPTDPYLLELQKEARDREKEYEKLQRDIEELSGPSDEVLAAQREEDELNAKEAAIKAGVQRSTAEISNQAIPYGFITGQSQAVERRANADLDTIAAQKIPIQMRLANEQARRAAALDVVKSKANYVGNRSSTASDRLYGYKSDEQKRKKDAAEKAAEPYTLSQGQTRYGPDGKIIANAPKTYAPSSGSKVTTAQKNAAIQKGESSLNQSRGEDGWVDPAVYQQAYKEWTAGLGTTAEFLSKFPPKNYVNPANNTLPIILRNSGGDGNWL